MKIHFISIEIGVIGRCHGKIQTECGERKDFDFVRHETHFVKCWLSIEYYNVAVSLFEVIFPESILQNFFNF